MSYKLPLFAAAAFLSGYMLISNRQLRVNKYELKVSKLPKNFVGKRYFFLQIFTRSVTGIISTIW